ncbi:hypothetical protein [Ferruginibacter profundus]
MNTRIRNFIFNGLTYGIIFFLLGFAGYYILNFPLQKALLNAVPIGVVVFIVNGLIQSRFTKSLKALEAITIPLQYAATVKLDAPANHMIDDHLVSGKLLLTENSLVFISFQQEQYSWPLNGLHAFRFHWSIFNAGGEFIAEDDSKNKLVFEVDEIRKWKKMLTPS